MTTTDAPTVEILFTNGRERQALPFPKLYLPDDGEFLRFCAGFESNSLFFEREATGEVTLMPPSGSNTGRANGMVFGNLFVWNRAQGSPGYVFDASSGFKFPSGAIRAPDVAYIEKSRYDALTEDEREHIAPIAPDFVVGVMSPTDRLARSQSKMDEYMANGVRLGWLIDRKNRTVYVYRPGTSEPETYVDPASVAAGPELPDFVLDLRPVFD